MKKPENPYVKRLNSGKTSILWSVFEGDWEDLTAGQIAQVLDTTPKLINTYISRIKRETGYTVPRLKGRPGRKPDE